MLLTSLRGLFRPSRPDFIETCPFTYLDLVEGGDCSGLLGRTSLRLGDANPVIQPVDLIVPAF